MIGNSQNGDFRWGLFKDNGAPPATGGWLGYIASAESVVWSKNPAGSNFLNATFASTAFNRGAELGAVVEPNGLGFVPGTYNFTMNVERYGDEVDVQIAIANSVTGFSIVTPAFTETNPTRLTFGFDRVGFLAGSQLSANQIRFSGIDVTMSDIEAPTLEVHSSGLVFITNPSGQAFDFMHYEVTSNSGALDPAGWTSLDSQEGNDPIGTGWDEAGGSDSSVLAEVNLLSTATLDGGERLGLGHAFASGGAHDLAFRFTTPEGEIRRGIVNYVLSGDYNGDGRVDAADYVIWRRFYGQSVPFGAIADGDGNGQIEQSDYDVWRSNFGPVAGSGASQATAVPEPTMIVPSLFLLAMVAFLRRSSTGTRRSKV